MVMVHAVNGSRSSKVSNISALQKKKTTAQVRDTSIKSKNIELLQQYQLNPSMNLRNKLVEMNLGLVRKEAHRWKNMCQESFDDLMQIGSIGLISSIERFDMSRGVAFSSFAMPYIRGEIQHYLRDKSNAVRIPRRWLALRNRQNKLVMQLTEKLGRAPSVTELREAMELTVDEWQQFQSACQNRSVISLDTPLNTSDGCSNSVGDLLPDTHYQRFQNDQEERLRLQQAMQGLEAKTRQILECVFFEDISQKDAAERLEISPVTVSRRIKSGVQELSVLLEGQTI